MLLLSASDDVLISNLLIRNDEEFTLSLKTPGPDTIGALQILFPREV